MPSCGSGTSGNPATLSPAAIGRLRERLPDTLLITDDMQMQGLQKALGTRAASLQSLKAGMDMLCIGNNLFDQEQEMADIADAIERDIARMKRWMPPPSTDRSLGSGSARPAADALEAERGDATLAHGMRLRRAIETLRWSGGSSGSRK